MAARKFNDLHVLINQLLVWDRIHRDTVFDTSRPFDERRETIEVAESCLNDARAKLNKRYGTKFALIE